MIEQPPRAAASRAVLVNLEFPGSDYAADVAEFHELARSAGAQVVAFVGGRRDRPDAGLFVGSGKAEQIGEQAKAHDAAVVLFNHELSPSQERNLEKVIGCRVLGRAGLILDIFAQRARSHEGKLQVELAQLQHMSTRLVRVWSHLDRQKGSIGLRGPGESQLETDRRLVRKRIAHLKEKLDDVRARRSQSRQARIRNEIPTVSLVGYTNAGKSTLFNALTGEQTFASSQLFATLDPTLRRLPLPPGEHIVLADTVGFIRDLPHDLVAAFRATLEESRDAGLLLHVIDAADPERTTRIEQVEGVLAEIGADQVPRLQAYNKIDLLPDESARVETGPDGTPSRVWVSALSGAGLEALRQVIRDFFYGSVGAFELRLPPDKGALRARLYELSAVVSESSADDGAWLMAVRLPHEQLQRLCREAGVECPPAPVAARHAA